MVDKPGVSSSWPDHCFDNDGNLLLGGVVNAYTAVTARRIFGYYRGLRICGRIPITSTGASTLKVDEGPIATIHKPGGVAIAAGDLEAGAYYDFVYDDTTAVWLMLGGAGGGGGAPGPTGPTGPRGYQGAPGGDGDDAMWLPTPGRTGRTGPRGMRGYTGAPGEDGEDGNPGAPGRRGAAGSAGAPGRRGLTGAPGEDGDDAGWMPVPGRRGPKGDTGAPGSGGGSGTTGTAIVDFGAFPGVSDASVAVTGQASIVAGSTVNAWIKLEATADHSADEHLIETISVKAGNIVPGTGFTIYALNTNQINDVMFASNGRGREVTTQTPMLYGQWSVNWQWS